MTAQPLVTALVLAGSRQVGDPVAEAGGVRNKAFVSIAGRTMIEHVVAAIRASGRVGEILISCEANIDLAQQAPELRPLLDSGEVRHIVSASGPSASTLEVCEQMPEGGILFLTTADHPLLTGTIISDFLDRFLAGTADVGVGLAPLALVEAAYPRNRRTALRFSDGAWSGCNLFVFRGVRAQAAVRLWRRIENDRKRPLRMAFRLGPWILVRYLLGLLSFKGGFDYVAARIGITAEAIIIENPDAATDVDSLEDLALVRHLMDHPVRPD